MKRLFPLVVLFAVSAGSLSAATVQEVYARAVRAYIGGDVDQAKALFEKVVAADPSNRAAKAYLKHIEISKAPGDDLRKRAASIIVPKVDFTDASLSSVLEYLPKVASEQTGGKETVNIVPMFPAEYGKDTKINLHLTNVPVASVLDYVAQLGGVKLDYQTNAVVVKLADAQ